MKVIKAFIRQRRDADLIHVPEKIGGVAKPKLERQECRTLGL